VDINAQICVHFQENALWIRNLIAGRNVIKRKFVATFVKRRVIPIMNVLNCLAKPKFESFVDVVIGIHFSNVVLSMKWLKKNWNAIKDAKILRDSEHFTNQTNWSILKRLTILIYFWSMPITTSNHFKN